MCEVPNIMPTVQYSTVQYSAGKVNPNKNTEGLNIGKIHCHFDGNVNVVVYQCSRFMFILIKDTFNSNHPRLGPTSSIKQYSQYTSNK